MTKHINSFSEDTIIQVMRAYLVEGKSHRAIQKKILRLPAPARGGGFATMDILHHFGIKGNHKSVLSNGASFVADTENLGRAINKVKEYIKLEGLALSAITSKDTSLFNKKPISEVKRLTKQRIGQNVLRKVVLENYSNTCALCNIHQTDLLVCSHIIPWSIDEDNRLNPTNAIILCSLHDSLFDKGYFSLDDSYNLVLNKKADSVITDILINTKFKTPIKDKPGNNFLKYHRNELCN